MDAIDERAEALKQRLCATGIDAAELAKTIRAIQEVAQAIQEVAQAIRAVAQAIRAEARAIQEVAQAIRAVARAIRAVAQAFVLAAEEIEAAIGSVVSGMEETPEELEKAGAFDTEPRARRKRRERDRDRHIRQAYRAEIQRCERERFVRRIWKPPRKRETPGRAGINGPRTSSPLRAVTNLTGELHMKRKQPLPGYYGRNIVRNAQKKYLQGRRRENTPPIAGKPAEKPVGTAENRAEK